MLALMAATLVATFPARADDMQDAAKLLKFGGARMMVGVDLYNALNSSAVLTYNNAFVPNGTWLQPQTVLTGRLIKIAAELTC